MNKSQDPACKTTLILAPTALLDQWKLEIEMKTNCDVKCLIYHGQWFSIFLVTPHY
jgi:SNF2 family DNA or RNA helicase